MPACGGRGGLNSIQNGAVGTAGKQCNELRMHTKNLSMIQFGAIMPVNRYGNFPKV